MNNSHIVFDPTASPEEQIDITPKVKAREQAVVKILEAVEKIRSSREWRTLKTELFDDLATKLERELRNEARKEQPDTNVLTRINGQLIWAERYADLDKLAATYRAELSSIKKQLYGTTDKQG
jgi:hypothetical protein